MSLAALALPLALALQLLLGLWVARRVRASDDFLVAGRRMGPGLMVGTVFATWFGAETCIGSAGSTFASGFRWDHPEPFAYGLCLILGGLLLAAPLWRRSLFTLADLFRRRFSPGVERLAALAMLPTSLLWAAAQIRALGHLVASSTGWGELSSVAVAALAGTLYTAAGGLMAVAVTDVFQGLLVILGLVVLTAAAWHGLDGPAVLGDLAQGASTWPAGAGAQLDLLEGWAVPILGSLVAQELVVRQSASRSARVARWGTVSAGAIYFAVGALPVFLGAAAQRAGLAPADPEGALPLLAQQLLGPVGFALFGAALSAAMLSTIDSTLLVCATLSVENLRWRSKPVPARVARPEAATHPQTTSRPAIDPLMEALGAASVEAQPAHGAGPAPGAVVQQTSPEVGLDPASGRSGTAAKLQTLRLTVLGFGLLAFLLALSGAGVARLVELASSLGSGGLLVVTLFGLFSTWGSSPSAYGALLVGLLGYPLASAAELRAPFLGTLVASAAVYVLLSPWRAAPAQAAEGRSA
jgi:Na+/proline symporter